MERETAVERKRAEATLSQFDKQTHRVIAVLGVVTILLCIVARYAM